MPSLLEIQRAVRRSIVLHQNDAAIAAIVGDGLAAEQRLAIYRNTFVGSLGKALRLTYPAIDRLVGADFFDGAAQAFVHDRPPRSAWLDEYGTEFAEFLERFPPAASVPYLADVARLEWAVSRALHAPDAQSLDISRLGAIDEADHEHIRFAPHPSVSLLHANYPVDTIWRAVLENDDEALAALDVAAGPVWLIIERTTNIDGIGVTRIGECAWRFAEPLFASLPLRVALGTANDVDAPAWLAEHLAAGRFVAFSVAGARDILDPQESTP